MYVQGISEIHVQTIWTCPNILDLAVCLLTIICFIINVAHHIYRDILENKLPFTSHNLTSSIRVILRIFVTFSIKR